MARFAAIGSHHNNDTFPCLIVEGTSGVEKSTLIDALRRIRTLLHSAQSHT